MRILFILLSIWMPCAFFVLKSRIDSIHKILTAQIMMNHFGSCELDSERFYLGAIGPSDYLLWLQDQETELLGLLGSRKISEFLQGIELAEEKLNTKDMSGVLQVVKETWIKAAGISSLKQIHQVRLAIFNQNLTSPILKILLGSGATHNHNKEMVISGKHLELSLRATVLIYKILACRALFRDSEYGAERRWLIQNFSSLQLYEVFGYSPLRLLYPRPYEEIVASAASSHQVSSALTFAVMKTESGFNPQVVSKAGAVGLMQVMPSTATGLLNKKGMHVSPLDLHEPKTGIGYGAQYLAHVISRYSNLEEALAAYNAGPTPVKRWQSRPGSFFENIGYLETRNYVLKVLLDYKMYADLY